MALGLLLLRLALGGLLLGHGLQKATGWFQGPGLAAASTMFETWGFRPGPTMVALAATCEVVAGLLVVLGAGTPLAASIVCGTMIVASVPAAANGFWAVRGGCEVPAVYGFIGLVLGFTGAGRYSIDHLVGTPSGVVPGVVSLAVALLVCSVPLLQRRRALAADRRSATNVVA